MSNEQAKNPPGRPRSEKADQAILQTTLALLAEAGYAAISFEAVAARAGVGKTTIYRRYSSKEELVADALESVRQEISLPDTGHLWRDIELLIESASASTTNSFGRQLVALIVSTASTHPHFAQVYWNKYMQPRQQAFSVILERAKARQEIGADIDGALVFDLLSGIMLYALMFPPTTESWSAYVRRALELLLRGSGR